MKKTIKIITACALILGVVASFTGCDWTTEADKVNHNMSLDAAYFNCERKIVVYNVLKDTIVFEMEGFLDISNNTYDELVVTCKVGENQYKKNYIYLNDFVTYTVEDITGTHADSWHYKMYYHTGWPIDVDVNKEP